MSAKVAIVIGSGFGGSVVAMRLAEAFSREQLRVVLLERGRRYRGDDFPRLGLPSEWTSSPELQTSKPLPDVARFSWQNDLGLWELRNLRGLQIAQAAGLGGGSLIYAAVHLRAPRSVFQSAWPSEYRDGLDAEYRKVEDMLRLQVAPPERWPKTLLMQQAARTLGRERDFFHPPLAINFKESADAPACSGCGNCTIGCPTGAKNSLDRNYLARAEEHGAEIRTLCEVVELEPLGAGGYRVRFRDHAFGGSLTELGADYVFVCAGALNSTELLMRSRHKLLAAKGGNHDERRKSMDALGASFFANGDALGVVFDADRKWQPTEGPTITSTLYVGPPRDAPDGKHAAASTSTSAPNGDGSDSWFLLQDGGMPWSLAPALNLLRSPLWLGRNQLVARGMDTEQGPLHTPQVRARGDFLAGLPGMLYRDGARPADSKDAGCPDELESSLWLQMLPRPARDHTETLLGLKRLVEKHLMRVVDRVVARADDERPGLSFFRWLARLDRDRLNALTKEVLEALYPAARVLLQSQSPWEVLAVAARNASRLDAPLDNAVVLLAMGADEALQLKEVSPAERHPVGNDERRAADPFFAAREARNQGAPGDDRELNCRSAGNGPQPPLRLEVVPAPDRTALARRQAIYRRQERLMSDIARAAGGELRTNPSWTIGRQPVTVHAQGGCAMGQVTSPEGQVLGFDNLYVMDAAVFPGSVGVNPSHTIAAVAERNIAAFIQRHRAVQPTPAAGMTAPAPDAASRVVQLEHASHPRPDISTGPAALVWRERLKGFFVAIDGPDARHELGGIHAGVDVFHECERQGALAGQRMELTVKATVRDLDAMVDGREPMVSLSEGKFTLAGKRSRPPLDVAGQLELQLGGTDAAPLARPEPGRPRVGGMVYRLTGPNDFRLYGFKQLTDDPGVDAWLDLTTLYVDVQFDGRVLRGILRVSITDFLRDQLPSFSVEKAGLAPEQQLWALGQFGRFFLGRVGRIYLPEWL